MTLAQDTLLDLLQIIEKIATVGAILIGGIWAYFLFVHKRIGKHRLNLEHVVTPVPFPDGSYLLQVSLRIDNVGQVRVDFERWRVRVQQVLPVNEEVAEALDKPPGRPSMPWPTVDDRDFAKSSLSLKRIEPRESDEAIADIMIPPGIDVVRIYSFVESSRRIRLRKKKIGWAKETIVDVRQAKAKGPNTEGAVVPVVPDEPVLPPARDRTPGNQAESQQEQPK